MYPHDLGSALGMFFDLKFVRDRQIKTMYVFLIKIFVQIKWAQFELTNVSSYLWYGSKYRNFCTRTKPTTFAMTKGFCKCEVFMTGFQCSVHDIFKLVAILLCIIAQELIFLTYLNIITPGLFFLFEDMVLYTAPSRCNKVNNKNLKDCGHFLMKRYFSLFFVEVVDSQGSSPNFTSDIQRILAY